MKDIRVITRYSEEVKRAVVHSVEELGMSVPEVCRHYKVKNRRTVYRWLQSYGNSRGPTKVVRLVMKSEQERIQELESLVAELSVRSKLLKAQVDIYEEITGEEVKKKLSMKQLRELEERRAKLGRLGG